MEFVIQEGCCGVLWNSKGPPGGNNPEYGVNYGDKGDMHTTHDVNMYTK